MPTLHFSSLHDFLHMGGYARYVWSAYAVGIGALLLNLVTTLRARKKLITTSREAQREQTAPLRQPRFTRENPPHE